MPKYNGHPSYNAWNVSLWINNDEGLYFTARQCVREARGKGAAAESFRSLLADAGVTHTPDGVPYTVTNIRRAMREM